MTAHASVGPVTRHLHAILDRQLREHGVVVWYDPERAFADIFAALDPPNVVKLAFDGSYFALRRAAEPYTRPMRQGQPPAARVLAYVPRAQLRGDDVLLPLTALGTWLDVSMADVARQALGTIVPAGALGEWLATPGITPATLEALAAAGRELGALAVIFRDDSPQEVAFRVLTQPEVAKDVRRHKLERALADFLGATFGAVFGEAAGSVDTLRGAFARRVLLTEFLSDLDEVPGALGALAVPAPAQVEACRTLADRLRRTRGAEESHRAWADEAEREWALAAPAYDPARIGRRDTLAFEERLALRHVAALARAGRWIDAAAWVAERSTSFWATVDAERAYQWDAARLAVALYVAADGALAGLPAKPQTPTWWVTRYVGAKSSGNGLTNDVPAALCDVDRLLRQLDARAAGPMDVPELDAVVRLARDRASAAERACAERFVESVRAAGGFEALPVQGDVFQRTVRPLLDAGQRTVFVLADALRYEMARDLEEALGGATLEWAVATPPTLTKVGMAALVPGAEGGVSLAPAAPAASGKGVEAVVGGVAVPGLAERLARYRAAYGALADHGFLLRDDVDMSMRRDLPAGEVLEAHRRCVVGRGLDRRDDLVVFRSAELGVGGGLELAFPCGVNVFKVPGNTAYFHGGLSLQELVVPVLRYRPDAVPNAAGAGALRVTVGVKPAVLRALVFQATVRYGEPGQAELMGAPRRLGLVVARGVGKQPGDVVGTTLGATHGFEEAGTAVLIEPGQESTLLVQLGEA